MSSFEVSRSTSIAATREDLFALIVDFAVWPRWSPFENESSDIDRDFRGPASGVGAVYEYKSNEASSAGIMTVTDVQPAHIDIHLEFLKPFKSEVEHRFSAVEASAAETEVTWTINGEHRGLMGIAAKLFMPMEKFMGPEMEKGLANLKALAE